LRGPRPKYFERPHHTGNTDKTELLQMDLRNVHIALTELNLNELIDTATNFTWPTCVQNLTTAANRQ